MNHVLVTYATHAQGMFDELMQSGHDIIVGGWGTKWTGFMNKIRFCRDVAARQPPNTIVIFLDGFDTKILKNPKVAVERFLEYGCRVLVSDGTIENQLPALIRQRIFAVEGHSVANSGLYMGYAADIYDILNKVLHVEHKDDQRGLNIVMQSEPPGRVVIDKACRVFCNLSRTERSPRKYQKKDAVFVQFNGQIDFSFNMFKKTFGYCFEFRSEIVIMVIASIAAVSALHTIEAKYNCSLATEVFGVVFPLLVLHVLFDTIHIPLSTSRVTLGMATGMLVFHLTYVVKTCGVVKAEPTF